MKILKRSGAEAVFDINKIIAAVTKANQTVDLKNTLTAEQIQAIGKYVEGVCAALDRALSVEEIQDIVETQIMKAAHSRWQKNILRIDTCAASLGRPIARINKF